MLLVEVQPTQRHGMAVNKERVVRSKQNDSRERKMEC